jgi:Type II secretion system (T2SS), protein E, N-terminal domain
VDAVVIDAHSPMVWGTAGEEREAPLLAPAGDTAARLRKGVTPIREETELVRLSRQYGLASADSVWMDPRAVALVPRALCDRYRVVPLSVEGGTLVVGMTDPRNVAAIYDLVLVTGLAIDPLLVGASTLTLFVRWNDPQGAVASYEDVMAQIPEAERPAREA